MMKGEDDIGDYYWERVCKIYRGECSSIICDYAFTDIFIYG